MSFSDIDNAHISDHFRMLGDEEQILGFILFSERLAKLPWALLDRQSKCFSFHIYMERLGYPPMGMQCHRVQSMLKIFPERWARQCKLAEAAGNRNQSALIVWEPREWK
jgi:hypothetical protein